MNRKRWAVVSQVAVVLLILALAPSSNLQSDTFDPWADLNGDGKVDINDLHDMAKQYGSAGTSINKSSLLFDSGWINITDKRGQSFNITHNSNSTDIIVDITGKMTPNGEAHQQHLLHARGFKPGFDETYGGTGEDTVWGDMVQTRDGGYALVGYTSSYGAGGGYPLDMWLVKTDSVGNVQWNKTYGESNDYGDFGCSVVQTEDGGYAVVGLLGSYGGYRPWLVKTDFAGNMQWNKTYAPPVDGEWVDLVQTGDEGYALVTSTSGVGGYLDFWFGKTDSAGNLIWNKTYGGTGHEIVWSLIQTADGGYAIAGYTQSIDPGAWLVKADMYGNMQWNRTYGWQDFGCAYSVVQAADGGYAMAGYTASDQFGLVKTDSTGTMEWNRTYFDGTMERQDVAYSVVQTADGGYALTGLTWISTYDYDAFLVITDSTGNMQCSQTYGGASYGSTECQFRSLVQTEDGGFALAGTKWVNSGDFWLIKTDIGGHSEDYGLGLVVVSSTTDTVTLYRGTTDYYWNYVRVRIWKIKENP